MKKILLLFLALLPLMASAYDAQLDGIYYNLDKNLKQATVTSGNKKYTGKVSIPATVKIYGTTYSVTAIGEFAFSGCSDLTSVTIPNSVTFIDDSAFGGCYGLTSIKIPDSVTSIEARAFYNCSGLTSLTIPNSVTSIGQYAFYGCSGLTSVEIGNSVKYVRWCAFSSCTGMKDVYCYADIVPTTESNAFSSSSAGLATLHVPKASVKMYKTTEPWDSFGKIVAIGEDEGIAINETNFPDENFRNWIMTQEYGNDGVLTDDEVASVTSINVSGRGIKSLQGIEFFTALTELSCNNNQLTSLDVSGCPNLKTLAFYCNQIKIAAMDKLVEKLPTLSFANRMDVIYFENEGNVMTTTQVAAAKAKNWIPYYAISDSEWEEYAGSEPVEGIAINVTNFPDENFRNYLLSLSYGSDGILTEDEIANVASINVSSRSIKSLQGIEFFTALKSLSCYNNQLTSIDISKNTSLTGLNCYNNQLTSIDISKNTAITGLYCYNNQLASLDVSGCTALTRLECQNNQLTSLDVTKNTALSSLNCHHNQLASLDVSQNVALFELNIYNNQLTSLDVSQCMKLTKLDCNYNKLISLNMSGRTVLTSLNCISNQLTSLNVSGCTRLKSLSCNRNQIKDAAMDAFVENLPTVNNIDLFIINNEYEGNIMTTTQVAAAKAKGWIPLYYDNGGSWKEFDGCEPGAKNVDINETNFPDANFRYYLQNQSFGGDGVLTVYEIPNLKNINVSGRQIKSLQGIEYFTSQTDLSCYTNKLTSLDVSKNTELISLHCGENQLTSLDVSKNTALTYLYCYTNQLTSLDVSKNTTMTSLYCYDNQLTSLDVSNNTELTYLYCYKNQIKGTAMDALVNSLPTIENGIMRVIAYDKEQNVMTTTQVAAAKAKGWTPYYECLSGYHLEWREYAGSEPESLRGDVNGDGIVNGTDIQAIINLIVESLYDEKGDVNGDGVVNGTDIQEVINIIVNAE